MSREKKKKKADAATAPARPKATCPVCEKERSLETMLAREAEVRRRGGWATVGWTVTAAQAKRLRWACDECLHARRALIATPWEQVYCCDMPYFAYADASCTCRDCRAEFVFKASEQLFWYETLEFTLSSWPVRCAACRKAVRAVKNRNDDLAKALHTLDPKDPDQLANVSTLYLELGLKAKAAEYLRRAKNKTRRRDRWEELVKRLEQIDALPKEIVIDIVIDGRTIRFRERAGR